MKKHNPLRLTNKISHLLEKHPYRGLAGALGLGCVSYLAPAALAIPIQVLLIVLIADFISGAFHWFEDAYGDPTFPFLGKYVFKPNLEHHFFPRAMTKGNWLQTSWVLVLLAGAALALSTALFGFSWQLALLAVIGCNGNEVHKWAHRTPKENGRVIGWLQEHGWVQGRGHHAIHHTDPKESHYCAMTNYLNPILDGIGFWEACEWLLEKSTGLKRRPDPSVDEAKVIPMHTKCSACPLAGNHRSCGCRKLEEGQRAA